MAASVAGFVAPGIIASAILRTPEEVAESKDHREFTAYALFAPVLSALTLIGVIYLNVAHKDILKGVESDEGIEATEQDALFPSKRPSRRASEPGFQFHPKTEAVRRVSSLAMGIPNLSYEPKQVTRPVNSELGLTDADF
jgi:hypothetical protein